MKYQWFLYLEKKSLTRGNKSSIDIVVSVIKWFGIIYIALMMLLLGISFYEVTEEFFPGQLPILVVSRFMIYYFTMEFMFRFFFQSISVTSIKSFLLLNIPRSKIVKYFVGKSYFSAFNAVQLFFLVPFCLMSIYKGEDTIVMICWSIAMYCLVLMMHSVTILTTVYTPLFYLVVGLVAIGGFLQYFEVIDPTIFTQYIFNIPYYYPLSVLGYFVLLLIILRVLYVYHIKHLYLDSFEDRKDNIGRDIQLSWLDRLGSLGPFLRNDIRLILRNKRARITVIMSALFIGYGLISYSEAAPGMIVICAFFSTGGFLMMFGQYVPSWDSSYYPLYMTQNVSYVDYLKSKWLIIVLGTFISTVLCFFYYFIYPDLFYLIIAMGIYNIGINGYIVLWGGAYLKSPVDLTSSKGVFGEKNAFNLKLLLITFPKILIPLVIFYGGNFIFPSWGGIGLLILLGILGLFFYNPIFERIEKIYKREKYQALITYKKG